MVLKWIILTIALFLTVYFLLDTALIVYMCISAIKSKKEFSKNLIGYSLLLLITSGLWAAFIIF